MAIADLVSSARDLPASFSRLHAGILLGVFSLYLLSLGIYRLYFSPIAHIPGPKLAALTWLYEFYYDIVLGGQYTFQIIALHQQYGPIIRINPAEVHVGDADFYSEVYATGGNGRRRRDKWRFYTKQFGADDSALATVDHDRHRLRRAAVAPFFSTQSVRRLQPVVEERADALLARLRDDVGRRGEAVDLMYPFSAFTNDVIEEYAFAKSHRLIESPTFGRDATDTMLTGTHYGKWIQHVEPILTLINALPEAVSSRLVPGWAGFLALKRDIRARIAEIRASASSSSFDDVAHPTVFHQMLSPKSGLPDAERAVGRLAQEGQILVQGGTLTTSWTLAVATFHLLDQPQTLARLRDALVAAGVPHPDGGEDPAPLAELENIPYLRAVVKESLRLGFGTSGRLARVAPDEALVYVDRENGRRYEIPPGVPVGMTTYKTVTDGGIFEEPFKFRPERWLGEGAEVRLDRYFTVFGGGSRVCLGMALAQAELFLMLAKMWRVWGGEGDRREGDVGVVRLFETTVRDCEMASDYFIPIPWKGTKGIRAVFEVFDR